MDILRLQLGLITSVLVTVIISTYYWCQRSLNVYLEQKDKG